MMWAKCFCATAKKLGHDLEPDWMVGWFANAIETASDVRHRRAMPCTRPVAGGMSANTKENGND